MQDCKTNSIERVCLIKSKYNEFKELILKELPSDIVVLLISIVGSRGKLLYSNESDFDIRIVFIDTYKNYLLQNIRTNIKIKTKINLNDDDKYVDIEGTAIELTCIFKFAVKSNSFASEIIKSKIIYINKKIVFFNILKKAFINNFNFNVALRQILGLINSDLKKNINSKEKKKCFTTDYPLFIKECLKYNIKAKVLLEVLYLILSALYLIEEGVEKWLDIYNINELCASNISILTSNKHEESNKIKSYYEFKNFVYIILNKRIVNKDELLNITEEDKMYIEHSIQLIEKNLKHINIKDEFTNKLKINKINNNNNYEEEDIVKIIENLK